MKIDTSTITGFDEMTAEQKIAALLGMEIPDPDMTGWVKKETFDAKATEAANLSKQLRARMTDEEAAKEAAAAAQKELQEKFDALLKESTISKYKAKYMALGYDEKLAEDTANAMADGDMEKVFNNGEKFKISLEKSIKADLLKGTPRPDGGKSNPPTVTKEQFDKMGYTERANLFTENKALYDELMRGE